MGERVGLLGWPLGHSLSPAMHNAAFAALGMDWRYELFPTPPERLAEEFARLVDEGVRGLNVTVPHKRAVLSLPQVRDVSADVRAIGAANTLVHTADGWRAENTDWRGFLDDLRAHGVEPRGMACVVLGTGGSARAVGYALRQAEAAAVTFVSRSPQKTGGDLAPPLATSLSLAARGDASPAPDGAPVARRSPRRYARGSRRARARLAPMRVAVVGYAALSELAPRADLIVNCTPLGMWPQVERNPWPSDVPFPARAVLYDLVYNPPVTSIMRQAQAAGARAVGGLGMLVRQGALAFAAWTGRTPSLDVMTRAARAALEER